MSFYAAAAIIGGSAIAGGFLGSSASKKAAQQQAAAIREATAFQREVFNKTQANLKPYMDFGLQGTTGISEMLPYFKEKFPVLKPSDVTQFGEGGYLAPYYDFMKNQGLQAIRQKQNVGGGGSNMDLASTRFATDYAKTGIATALAAQNQAYTQFTGNQRGIYDRLFNIANMGQSSAAMSGNIASQMAPGIAQGIAGEGAVQAGGTLGQANAWTGALQSLGSAVSLPFMGGGSPGRGSSGQPVAMNPYSGPQSYAPAGQFNMPQGGWNFPGQI